MDYAALYDEATYETGSGVSVFAGTVDDPFFIDLGAAFDTANFRTLRSGIPGVLTGFEDMFVDDNIAADTLSGFAVNTIALEVPIEMLTSTGQVEPATAPAATIGVWGTTSRQRMTVRSAPDPGGEFGRIQSDSAYRQSAHQRVAHRHRPQGSVQHGRAGERRAIRELLPRPSDRWRCRGSLRRRARGACGASERLAAARHLHPTDRGRRNARRSGGRSPATEHGRLPDTGGEAKPARRPRRRPRRVPPTVADPSTTWSTSRCASALAACSQRRSPATTRR